MTEGRKEADSHVVAHYIESGMLHDPEGSPSPDAGKLSSAE